MSIIKKTGVGLRYPIRLTWQGDVIETYVKGVSFAIQNLPTVPSIHVFGCLTWQDPVFHENPADLFENLTSDQITLFMLLNDSIKPFVENSFRCAQAEIICHIPQPQLAARGEMFDLGNPSRKLILNGIRITGVDKDEKMVQASVDFMSPEI